MKLQYTFACTILCLPAIFLSACTALPINVTSIASNYTSELAIGILALICISIAIVACACCHRNKSGFKLSHFKDRKEFENENTLTYNTNSSSRSEFPIFRAITPLNIGHHHLNASNSSESAVIIDNRTPPNDLHEIHLDIERNLNDAEYNNNGPISTIDLENIQNNNAVDYIQNRYELEANQQRGHANHVNAATATIAEVSIATNHIPEFVDSNNQSDELYGDQFVFAPVPPPADDFEEFYFERTSSTKTRNIDLLSDDSVEEALRALDTAISVGETLLFDDPDDSDLEYPDNPQNIFTPMDEEDLCTNNFTIPSQFNAHAISETFDAKDITSSNENDKDLDKFRSSQNDIVPIGQTFTEDVREAAKVLVDDVLAAAVITIGSMRLNDPEECDVESQMPIIENMVNVGNENGKEVEKEENSIDIVEMDEIVKIANKLVDEIADKINDKMAYNIDDKIAAKNDEYKVAAENATTEVVELNDEMSDIGLDDSLNVTFVAGQLIASTPCHKNEMPTNRETNKALCLFQALNEVNESDLSADGIGILQTTQPKPMDESYAGAAPIIDQTIVLATNDKTRVNETVENYQNDESSGAIAVEDGVAKDNSFIPNETYVQNGTFTTNTLLVANGTFVANSTFAMCDNNEYNENANVYNYTVNVANPNPNQTYIAPSQSDSQEARTNSNPIIKIDRDEGTSDDLTTITPMNTPIELNYVGDSWDKFVSNSSKKVEQKITNDQLDATPATDITWYLHPQQQNGNATFDMNDGHGSNYDGMDEDSDSLEENPELLSLTFDALRKQLADVLPHASVRPSIEYSDDDDEYNGSDSDPDCDDPSSKAINSMLRLSLKGLQQPDDLQTDVIINYKQQLSPIMEESEDETCKTFVFNETKCMDSTSTGCIETSEAIMGVAKVLMASNDTLFNFEDTLGDRDDMFSPRHLSAASDTNGSNTPQPSIECKTPTNELHAPSIDDLSEETPTLNENMPKAMLLNLVLDNTFGNLNELLSPEQQKTFSEEINTIEQVSSDLSATIEGNTNTLDDLKTCISVHINTDANNANNTLSETNDKKDDISLSGSVMANYGVKENAERLVGCSSNNLSNNSSLDSLELAKIAVKEITSSEYGGPSNQNDVTAQENALNVCDKDDMHALSGEEDPWASHSMLDDVYPSEEQNQRLHEEYGTNDWDSDIEDSNSSEEFLYTKETTELYEYLNNRSNSQPSSSKNVVPHSIENNHCGATTDEIDEVKSSSMQNESESDQRSNDEPTDTQEIWNVWNSHEDLIAVSTNAGIVDSANDMLDDSSLSDNEDEWVPSSWDSLAKPVRSALKSPDKSSSEEETSAKNGSKNRRNVVFKKQHYHNVYEYPKENAVLSPTTNENKIWTSYLANSSPFSTSVSDSYLNNDSSDYYGKKHSIDFNALDGFTVSSSSRPFHLSQYSSDCHTWPTDSDFSWSQLQNAGKLNSSDRSNINNEPIEWKFHSNQTDTDKTKQFNEIPHSDNNYAADNQPNDTAEKEIYDKLSLGELCHTKSSLRLPLNVYVGGDIKDIAQAQPTPADDQIDSSKTNSHQDFSETSYTGSMDSINSFDGGKITQTHSDPDSTNADGLTVNSQLIVSSNGSRNENTIKHGDNETFQALSHDGHDGHVTDESITINSSKLKCDLRSSANRQSDSTDEDSGIENIRIAKEI